MSDAYAPDATSPGIEAARRASGDTGLLAKADRMEVAKQAMRGSVTAQDIYDQTPQAGSVTPERADRETFKAATTLHMGAAERAAQSGEPTPLPLWPVDVDEAERRGMLDDYDHWFMQGIEQGYVDQDGATTDAAEGTDWLEHGEQAGWFPDDDLDDSSLSDDDEIDFSQIDFSQFSDEEIGDAWLAFGEQYGWVDENGQLTDDVDPDWVDIGLQAGYLTEST